MNELKPVPSDSPETGRGDEKTMSRNRPRDNRIEDSINDPIEKRIENSINDPIDKLIDDLLEGPYWIVDILPEQVPAESGGRYFAVEGYFLQPERISALRRKFAEILLKLNCYWEMAVSFDNGAGWEKNPDPEKFAESLVSLPENGFARVMFEKEWAMIDIEPDDTYMTVYDPDLRLMDKLRALAAAEGLFVWSPPT